MESNNLWTLCHSLEDRTLRLSGFVPCRRDGSVIGASGVTIGYGVDLGQQGEHEISGWPEDVKAIVRPYLSPLRGDAAKEYLRQHPLHITTGQCRAVQTVMETACESALASKLGEVWDSAPGCVKAALCSLSWQLGHIWARNDCKAVWSAASAARWNDLPAAICTCGPAGYETRRNAEADYIQKGLTNA